MGIRRLLAAAMTVIAHQRGGAFRAGARCFNVRRRRGSHWSQRFHGFGYLFEVCIQAALYRQTAIGKWQLAFLLLLFASSFSCEACVAGAHLAGELAFADATRPSTNASSDFVPPSNPSVPDCASRSA